MAEAKLTTDIAKVALPVLVERLGGQVTITEAEYQAMGARYGGVEKIGLKAEYVGGELRLSLVSAPPANPVVS